MKQTALAAMLIIASISCAVASPLSDAAQTHFTAIGAGDTSSIMRGYADNAQLTWVGGPLDGMYAGADAIRATWEKFGKAVGPARVTVLALEESANPKGATIVAKVQFDGKAQVNVRYVLTYRDGKLVNETWQIDPKLAAAAY
jgi:opacity protein-like surface antigen